MKQSPDTNKAYVSAILARTIDESTDGGVTEYT